MRYIAGVAFCLVAMLCAGPTEAQNYPHDPQTEGLNITGANGGLIHGQAVINLFASPPCIGCTAAAPGTFTTLSAVTSLTANNIMSTQLPGLSANVLGTSGFPGLQLDSCASAATCTFFIYQVPTTSAASVNPAFYVQRNALNLVGGTSGNVTSAIDVIGFTGKNDINWESNINSFMHNQSLGTNAANIVAGAFETDKENPPGGGEVGASWGINPLCADKTAKVNPNYQCLGAEIGTFAVSGAGTDANLQRVGLNIVGGVYSGTDAGVHIGRALFISIAGNAVMDHVIDIAGATQGGTYGSLWSTSLGAVSAVNGLDWSNVNFSGFILKTPNLLIDNNGNFTLSAGTGIVNFNPPIVGNRLLQSETNGVLRWQEKFGDATAEGGANAGSNFSISNFSDAGAFLGSPIQINRASGLVTLSSLDTVSYASGGTAGVTCAAGVPSASFTAKNGLVTHC